MVWRHARINTVWLSSGIFIIQRWCQQPLTQWYYTKHLMSDSAHTISGFRQIQSVDSWLTAATTVFKGYTGCFLLLRLCTAHKRENAEASSESLCKPSALIFPVKTGDSSQSQKEFQSKQGIALKVRKNLPFLILSVLRKFPKGQQNTQWVVSPRMLLCGCFNATEP